MKIEIKFMNQNKNNFDKIFDNSEALSTLNEDFEKKDDNVPHLSDEESFSVSSEQDFENLSEILDSEPIAIDEKSVKTYWTNDTEDSIIQFLYLNEFFFENRIKEEYDEAKKENRPIKNSYIKEMQCRMEEVLKIEDRLIQREKIFKNKIETPLKKLAENILFSYRLFVPDIDVKTQQKDCFTFLYTKFTNFNPWKKTKSFSFFGTIAKHHYLGNRKEHNKTEKILNNYESKKEEADNKRSEDPKAYAKEEISLKLFSFIIESMESELVKNNLSKNDKKIGNAIIDIFKNHEILGVYNKNQIYQLIKENSGLEAKEVTYSLHRFRVLYKPLKQSFIKKRDQ